MNVNSSQIDLLARLMDAAGMRHRVIANNVANVNTPNFKRQQVLFEDEMAKALHGGDVASVKPTVGEDTSAAERVDGNTVDIDKEMGDLTKNALLYNAAAQIVATRLATLRSAISGR